MSDVQNWVDGVIANLVQAIRDRDDARAAADHLQARLDVAEQELAIVRTQRDTERALRTGALR